MLPQCAESLVVVVIGWTNVRYLNNTDRCETLPRYVSASPEECLLALDDLLD